MFRTPLRGAHCDRRKSRPATDLIPIVVVAEVLGAELVVRQDTPTIRETAAARGIPYRVDV